MGKYGQITEFNQGSSWNTYSQKLHFFYLANSITEDEEKRNIFLTVCGDFIFNLAASLLKPVSLETASYSQIKSKLDTHFCPTPNPIVERFKFNRRIQGLQESSAEYIAELRRLSEHCQFSDLDDRLRDRLVCGTKDESLQHRFFEVGDELTFQTAMDMAIGTEVAQRSVQEVRSTSNTGEVYYTGAQRPGRRKSNSYQTQEKDKSKFKRVTGQHRPCFRCGDDHPPETCRFREVTCHACGKIGHIRKACITKKIRDQRSRDQYVERPSTNQHHLVAEPAIEASMYHLGNHRNEQEPIYLEVELDGKNLRMEVDSGTGHSIIGKDTYLRLWPEAPPLQNPRIWLKTWTQQTVSILGALEVKVGKDRTPLMILVADGSGPSLIGRDWFHVLGIRISTAFHLGQTPILQKHSSLFDEALGQYRGPPITIDLQPDATPIFLKSRPVPFALRARIEAELDKEEKAGILERVLFSKWATPIVPIVKGDGEIRICGDYAATVNKAIQRVVHPLHTANEIFSKLAGCNVFSKLDLEYAYLQLRVDGESADVLTLNTCKGLYRVHRLPFGISSAPGLFQRFMDMLLAGLEGVADLLDDIIVGGKDEEQHWERMDKVLTRLEDAGLRLKQRKCVFGAKSVHFLGYRVDGEGIHPTGEKVEAIQKAPAPTNKTELQAFLGLYNFYERFLPQKSTILEPLHRLLDSASKWTWGQKHQGAFEEAKRLLKSETVLTHYDGRTPLVLACDASPYGVGAVLAHRMEDGTELPIAYGSKTLQNAERNYAQIDKEALAVIFGVKKFHQYLFGRPFVIATDHKPLLGLFHPRRQIPTMISPRMLRWKLMLGAYEYEIEHRPGKQMGHADGLSRLPMKTPDVKIPMPAEVFLFETVPASPLTAKKVAEQTRRDPILARVLGWIMTGWPNVSPGSEYEPFFRRKNEMSSHRNCLLWGNRIIIPSRLHQEVLELLHSSHQGIVQTKAIARCHAWWPGMDSEIETLIRGCERCQLTRNDPPKAEPHPWIWPSTPWSRVHIDFAGPFHGQVFLLLVDAFSKWPEVKLMPSMSSGAVIKALRDIFSTHGLPEVVVSDNGTAYNSTEFQEFLQRNGIRQMFAPPYHPPSNGQVERMVQTVKQHLRRITKGEWSTRLARILLALRTTPSTTSGIAPAEALMKRRPRTLLDRLHPDSLPTKGGGGEPPPVPARRFNEKEPVYIRNYRPNQPRWAAAEITEIRGPVTYNVTTPDGQVQHRHLDQIRPRLPEPEVLPGTNLPAKVDLPDPEAMPTPEVRVLRRSGRNRTIPRKLEDYVL